MVTICHMCELIPWIILLYVSYVTSETRLHYVSKLRGRKFIYTLLETQQKVLVNLFVSTVIRC